MIYTSVGMIATPRQKEEEKEERESEKKEKRKEKRKPREKLQKLTENRFERKSLGTSTLTEKCQTETFK